MTDPRIAVEYVRPDTLVPDPRNPRRMSDEARERLRRGIERFGLVDPILARREDHLVIGGHQRLEDALRAGTAEVPVVFLAGLDDGDTRALNVLLNNPAAQGEWDLELLDQVLAELERDGYALEATGFDDRELKKLLARVRMPGQVDPDDVPDLPDEPVTRPGDLWVLGEHRLICGSSTDPEAVRRVLQDDVPRVLLTDPPYGVELDMEWRDRAGMNALGAAQGSYMRRGDGHTNTSISGDTKADWSDAFELVPSLDTAYVWHASAFSIEVGLGLKRIGFELKQQIIWRKPHFALSRQHYHWQHEPCWYARKSGAGKFLGPRDQSTIWDAASPKMIMSGSHEEKVDHPTQKPVSLYARPIENHLEPGDCFYEPFGGSGTAIIAAEQTRRRCFAVELDPKYVDVIVRRWEGFTGKTAQRVR